MSVVSRVTALMVRMGLSEKPVTESDPLAEHEPMAVR
jgi:hypothetical protein